MKCVSLMTKSLRFVRRFEKRDHVFVLFYIDEYRHLLSKTLWVY